MLAELAGFRPCLICRPELAPGARHGGSLSRLAKLAWRRIEEGALADDDLASVATGLGISDRHLRRLVRAEYGVTPIEIAQTQRLLAAKQLLTDTSMSVGEVALASGFSSVRRFNALFQNRYRLRPTDLRKNSQGLDSADALVCHVGYRPPYDFDHLISFLGSRASGGVEYVEKRTYQRSVKIGERSGWLWVSESSKPNSLEVRVGASLAPVLPRILNRVRHVFDTAADPSAIQQTLGSLCDRHPGLRVPGAFDGFEVAVRAVLGQQISVKAATTLSSRLAKRFGDPIETPFEHVTHLFPTPEVIAQASEDEVAKLGIVGTRSRAIIQLAVAVQTGELRLVPGADAVETTKQLEAIPGLGPWTSQYIAMRALAWPDAFMPTDLGIMKALGERNPSRILEIAEAWRPWRSYAGFHLWASLEPVAPENL